MADSSSQTGSFKRRRTDFELQQNESRLRHITDSITAYIAYVDTNLRYAVANRTYELMFNREPDQLVGHAVADILGPSYNNVKHHLEAALAGTPQHFETRMLTVNGERILGVSHLPDYDANGVIQGVIVQGFDITERKRAEAALLQTEKLAAVGRLASSVAHEINNPLESVVNLLYLIERTVHEDPHQAAKFALLAQDELARVSEISTQTLRFFKQSTAPTRTDIARLVDNVLAIHQGRLTNSSIHVRSTVQPGTTLVCLDGEIRQLLSTVILNAIDAMRTGGTLTLRARPATHPVTAAPGLRITVADSGHGMAPTIVARIFEAFFTTRGITSTGLGLWIAQGIVTKHHGSLTVRSRAILPDAPAPHGTVFSLFLPEPS